MAIPDRTAKQTMTAMSSTMLKAARGCRTARLLMERVLQVDGNGQNRGGVGGGRQTLSSVHAGPLVSTGRAPSWLWGGGAAVLRGLAAGEATRAVLEVGPTRDDPLEGFRRGRALKDEFQDLPGRSERFTLVVPHCGHSSIG
jgi:hypothetical protein